jgi:hypothetical protein
MGRGAGRDEGPFENRSYGLTDVTDSTLMGRWSNRGLMVFKVNRNGSVTRGAPHGLFCARRIQ